MRFKDKDDINDAARLPLPCDPDPVQDVEFLNPMYPPPTKGRHSRIVRTNGSQSNIPFALSCTQSRRR
ncbi:hypothetical protein DPMN_149296 [Dreissena polymorpha]|uniref:Uncharacterized protein n=2 Tax=Dreissena polymorpha TaxID=45954 RepID=A0A9D4FH50_DREPO|nr:hypothetical protein DPMN_149296 [Dreissena polymorpha]